MSVTLSLAVVFCAAAPQSPGETAIQQQQEFSAPIRLTADGEPLGQELPYPSPRLFDIDSDGVAELVIGDLRGKVRTADRLEGGAGAWSALKAFKTDGRDLKFSNW